MKKLIIVIVLLVSIFILAGCQQKTTYSSHSVVYIPEKKIEETKIEETVIHETIITETFIGD